MKSFQSLAGGLLALAVHSTSLAAQGAGLSLGDAARLAARQSGAVEIARTRIDAAEARTRQRRGAMLPELVAGIQQASRTTNSATFGFALRDATRKPLLDPNAQLIGPVPTVDLRYRVTQP